jgi:hypothetical protein
MAGVFRRVKKMPMPAGARVVERKGERFAEWLDARGKRRTAPLSKDGNGILFEGTEGRFHVSRGAMKGKPAEDLMTNPITEERLVELYKGKKPGNHMGNFFECIKDRTDPISDVYSHHRAMTTCHLANIAIRLGRKINWDSEKEQIVGDSEANQWLAREQRKGYEIDVVL